MGYQRRGEFAAGITAIRALYSAADEIKWNKCSRKNLPFYKGIVDWFFQNGALLFHCMIVARRWVAVHDYHNGSYERAREKHFTKFLTNKVKRVIRENPGRLVSTRVYVDEMPSSYDKVDEVIEIVGNHMINKSLAGMAEAIPAIDSVYECDSHEYNAIQVADLLLGAVIDTWNDRSTNEAKAALKRHIAGYLGWEDLKSDTRPTERKFNIWWLTDKVNPGDVRPVHTRPVTLRHPLPPRERLK